MAIICAMLLVTLSGAAQDAPPVNDRANPYALVRNWPQLPEGRTLGAVEPVTVEPERGCEDAIEDDEPRLGNRRWRGRRVEELWQLGVGVLEPPAIHQDHRERPCIGRTALDSAGGSE